jgi:hypothetical protein
LAIPCDARFLERGSIAATVAPPLLARQNATGAEYSLSGLHDRLARAVARYSFTAPVSDDT